VKMVDMMYSNFKIQRNQTAEEYNSQEQVTLRQQVLACIHGMGLIDSVQTEWAFSESDCLAMLGTVQQAEESKDEAKELDLPGSEDSEETEDDEESK
jgi:hypothetical protein